MAGAWRARRCIRTIDAMSDKPLFDPRDFAIADGITHVCAGGETAALRRHDAALSRYLRDKSSGMAAHGARSPNRTRPRRHPRSWGVDTGSIGFVSNVAEGVSIVAESLDWREGDNIVIDADEYPSVVGPFLLHRQPKIALRQARGTEPDRLAACVDARTRVIGVSYVSYLTGERHDLAAIRSLADKVGALLVVDFTQASGYLPIDASVADFAFSACYKWLLGITGVAIAYWNLRANPPGPRPPPVGTPFNLGIAAMTIHRRSVRMRYGYRGNPAHAPVYVLAEALDYLAAHDIGAVLAHVQSLTTAMIQRLHGLQIPMLTPTDPAPSRCQRSCRRSMRGRSSTG